MRDDSIDTVEVYAALNELPDTLRALPHSLHILEVSATAAVDKLRLVGRRGNVTPWQTSTATAKVRLAACGLRVFQAVRGLKRLPGDKNEGLHGFLAWVWEARRERSTRTTGQRLYERPEERGFKREPK